MPIAHSHESLPADDIALAAHLQSKHAEAEDCSCLHWHLVMPWDTCGHDEENGESPSHHSSPLGLWGAEGEVLPQSVTFTDPTPIALERFVSDLGNADALSVGAHGATGQPMPGNFAQTYLGVPLCALLCVSLR